MTKPDKEELVQKTMTRKQFFSLFPWKNIAKLYFLFILYIVVSSIIFFSTEQCLNEQNTSTPDNKPNRQSTKNCTSVSVHYGAGIHVHGDRAGNESTNTNKDDDVIDVQKCTTVEDDEEENKKCKLKAMNMLKWLYFTIVHFHGSDTFFLRTSTAWGQTVAGPIFVLGIAMATRLYTTIGFVGVNTLNFILRKIRARLRLHRKASLKYEVALVACVMKAAYVIFCALVTMPYARAGITFRNLAYKWLMLLSTVSDESLVPDCFTGAAQEMMAPIVLVFVGYLFTSTFVGSLVNCKYRLTYKVHAKVQPKKTGLQGWCV